MKADAHFRTFHPSIALGIFNYHPPPSTTPTERENSGREFPTRNKKKLNKVQKKIANQEDPPLPQAAPEANGNVRESVT